MGKPVMDDEDAVRAEVAKAEALTSRLVDVLKELVEWDALVFQSGSPVWAKARRLLEATWPKPEDVPEFLCIDCGRGYTYAEKTEWHTTTEGKAPIDWPGLPCGCSAQAMLGVLVPEGWHLVKD